MGNDDGGLLMSDNKYDYLNDRYDDEHYNSENSKFKDVIIEQLEDENTQREVNDNPNKSIGL